MLERSLAAGLAFILVVACSGEDDGPASPDAGMDAGSDGGAGGTQDSAADGASQDAPGDAQAVDASPCAVPLPAPPCVQGDLHCTSSDKACPGEQYSCEGGVWQKDDLNQPCTMLGHDFAFGCAFDPVLGGVVLICGNCDAGADACAP